MSNFPWGALLLLPLSLTTGTWAGTMTAIQGPSHGRTQELGAGHHEEDAHSSSQPVKWDILSFLGYRGHPAAPLWMTSTQRQCNSSAGTVPAWHSSEEMTPKQDISLQTQRFAGYVLSNRVHTPCLRMQFPKLIHLSDRKHFLMFRCNFSHLISFPSSQWNHQETLNTLPPPPKFL